MMKPERHVMQAAIDVAENFRTPFGAALAMGDEIFETAANQTLKNHDATAHAEIHVIRKLSKKLRKSNLSGFTLYTTCEPCPMCMSAAIWSEIEAVVYGCSIPDISRTMPQIQIRCHEVAEESFRKIDVHPAFMEKECLALLNRFS